jgi:2,3-diaminopropionate biosynthesis protein SbnB
MSIASGDSDRDLFVVGADDIRAALDGHEKEVLLTIKKAYEAHSRGQTSLPHSIFLHFPADESSRIIALPAYIGGETNCAGLKWIASVPANLERGLDRASAVLILNSPVTGRPKAMLEGSIISAWRTAASAVLASTVLSNKKVRSVGFIGCGLINRHVAQFIVAIYPDVRRFFVFDSDPDRARKYKEQCESQFPGVKVETANGIDEVLRNSSLISFATTAKEPYVDDLDMCSSGSVILHISLRDLAPTVILACDNVVDDVDHVCRAQTSLHLAEQNTRDRKFIRCTLGDILTGKSAGYRDEGVVVFSPFGLGILDVALGVYVLERTIAAKKGCIVQSFLPDSWDRTSRPLLSAAS